MGLHVLGRKCPVCKKKGLVIGADSGFRFRPQGWLMKRLAGRAIACPHCGLIMTALLPESLEILREELREDRATEEIIYHSKTRKKAAPPSASDDAT